MGTAKWGGAIALQPKPRRPGAEGPAKPGPRALRSSWELVLRRARVASFFATKHLPKSPFWHLPESTELAAKRLCYGRAPYICPDAIPSACCWLAAAACSEFWAQRFRLPRVPARRRRRKRVTGPPGIWRRQRLRPSRSTQGKSVLQQLCVSSHKSCLDGHQGRLQRWNAWLPSLTKQSFSVCRSQLGDCKVDQSGKHVRHLAELLRLTRSSHGPWVEAPDCSDTSQGFQNLIWL